MTFRRDFLAFTAGAVAAGTVLPAVAGELLPSAGNHPDAELIGWCAALIAMEAQHVRELLGNEDVERPDGYDATLDAVENTLAKTDDGNRAKLATAVAFYDSDPPEEGSLYARVLWDAVCALAKPPSETAIVAVDLDAKLRAACVAFDDIQAERVEAEAMEAPYNDEDLAELCGEWDEAVEAVTALPARTISGCRAKARVLFAALNFEVPYSIGKTVEDEGGAHDVLALSLCRDLLGGLV